MDKSFRTLGFIGDSITSQCPWHWYFNGAVNLGIPGQDTAAMAARFQADVLNRQPPLWGIHILGGTNNVNAINLDIPAIVHDIWTMAQLARNFNIKPIIGLIPPVPTSTNRQYTTVARVKDYNAALVVMARECGFAYVDHYAAFLTAWPDQVQDTTLFTDDSPGAPGNWVHPKYPEGYDRMARAIEPMLRGCV